MRYSPLSRSWTFLLGVTIVIPLAGCTKITKDYGFSSAYRGTQSLNGFSALRQTFTNSGFECRDVRRLSDRQNTTDTLVWTPQVLSSIDDEMTDWFDQWLAMGGHTLVYVIPDSGSEADYWLDATHNAPPSQQLEYRRRAAQAVNDRFEWRLNRSDVPSNGWFQIKPIAGATPLADLNGRWSSSISQAINTSDTTEPRHVELALEAYGTKANAATSATSTTTPAPPSSTTTPGSPGNTNTTPVVQSGPTGPSSGSYLYFPTVVTPTSTKVKFEPLLSCTPGAASETCFVGRVTSSNWSDSQILVVAGGSLLTNYAFTGSVSKSLAEQIVDSTLDPSDSELMAGFITSEYGSVPISELKPGEAKASGMELLTTWPLSLVTIHTVFLGIVALLILLPIFGRPRQVIRSSLSRFGDHLDAVAALMYRARGEEYALRRISEYHRRVRGETTGPWVLPESHSPTTPPNSTNQQPNPNTKQP